MPDSLHDLARDLDRFAADRDWHQYHAPKNLASALIVEAAELLEHFQWMTEAESRTLSPEKLAEVRGEMADVLLYLVQLGNVLGVDVVAAGREKLAVNAGRFPAGGARGTARQEEEAGRAGKARWEGPEAGA
ncbi:MAG: nucleotide pyrophosphohydrolase [Lautropia sp.]